VSLLIGFPMAAFLTREYLSAYAFHAEVSWSVYALTALLMLCIVVLSVGYQSAKAAVSNPVEALKRE
jgi:putative ABC transport system permease protein